MDEIVRKVLHALNRIEVHGSTNLNLMLACIQELEKLERRIADADQPVEREHV